MGTRSNQTTLPFIIEVAVLQEKDYRLTKLGTYPGQHSEFFAIRASTSELLASLWRQNEAYAFASHFD
jgi:hypothetical protein